MLPVGEALRSQPRTPVYVGDPCGLPDTTSPSYKLAAASNWGYGYDSLLADIQRWRESPFVQLDSIGTSVQGRTLYVVTIEDTARSPLPRKRVWMHARTHPGEVQGTWVTNETVAILLDDSPLARRLRQECTFSVLPMYNPDGVELGRARQNANGVDLESNWDVLPGEPEVQALRNHFGVLMAQANPILVALNMHSSVACVRYFVGHAATGTSPAFVDLQVQFIDAVRAGFPGGIEPWSYFVTWQNDAPTVYPESWFWYNHRESVMALTYEDMNCASSGAFDRTARALLGGIGEYVGIPPITSIAGAIEGAPAAFALAQNYPNPFNPTTTIDFTLPEARYVVLAVYDLLGRQVARPVDGGRGAGSHRVRFDAGGLAAGTYLYRLVAGEYRAARRLVLLR